MGVVVDYVVASQRVNSVLGCPTGTGNGTQTAFGLLRPSGILIPNLRALNALHRTDWQGRQLLYPTARTNYFIYSASFNVNSWNQQTGAVVGNVSAAAPDGSASVISVVPSTNGGTSGVYLYGAGNHPEVITGYYASIFIKANGITQIIGQTGSGDNFTCDLTAGTASFPTSASSYPVAGLTALGSGWFRLFYEMGTVQSAGLYLGANSGANSSA